MPCNTIITNSPFCAAYALLGRIKRSVQIPSCFVVQTVEQENGFHCKAWKPFKKKTKNCTRCKKLRRLRDTVGVEMHCAEVPMEKTENKCNKPCDCTRRNIPPELTLGRTLLAGSSSVPSCWQVNNRYNSISTCSAGKCVTHFLCYLT